MASLRLLGLSADFSLLLPNDFTFDYDLSMLGDKEVTRSRNGTFAGYAAVPEPAILTFSQPEWVWVCWGGSGGVYLDEKNYENSVQGSEKMPKKKPDNSGFFICRP